MAMDYGSRPGGLTALAVLNFIFGGSGLISTLAIMSMERYLRGEMEARMPGGLVTITALGLLSSVLLIASGIGYLRLRRFLGKGLGNLYSLVDLARVGLLLAYVPGFFTLIGVAQILYPLYTLVLLNTTFRADFVNP